MSIYIFIFFKIFLLMASPAAELRIPNAIWILLSPGCPEAGKQQISNRHIPATEKRIRKMLFFRILPDILYTLISSIPWDNDSSWFRPPASPSRYCIRGR